MSDDANLGRPKLTGLDTPRITPIYLTDHLALDRCPLCGVAKPTLPRVFGAHGTKDHLNKHRRQWCAYQCTVCGGLVLAGAPINPNNGAPGPVNEIYPTPRSIDDDLPERARRYLQQAIDSLNSPDGAVMLAASAVDAMLKAKNYSEGSLYIRIKKAADNNVITKDMERWAHQIRLEANDPRHADSETPHHDIQSAERVLTFARALGQFMFSLPAMVTRGIEAAGGEPKSS